MKKLRFGICIVLCIFLLCGCEQMFPFIPQSAVEPSVAPSQAPIITEPASDPATEPAVEPEPTEPEPTEPEHSDLYIPGVDVEDVITYFNEVCLDAEFVHGGDATVVQKWMEPIFYAVYGTPTEKDLEVLNEFTVWLNNYPGFPGIYEASNPDFANLRIYFCTQPELVDRMGSDYVGLDGAVTFWYMDNVIYDEVICVCNDIDQYARNSVILEEVYNGLGPVQDTMLRPDSLIYAEYVTPQALTEVDELILKLLYHPDIKCGMNAEECAQVIRQLYY